MNWVVVHLSQTVEDVDASVRRNVITLHLLQVVDDSLDDLWIVPSSDPAGLLRLSGWTPDWGREGSEQTGPDDHLYWWGISPWFSSGGHPGRRYCLCSHLFPRSCWVLLCSSRCNSGTCRLQPETPERSDEQSSRLISGRSHTLFWRSQYKLLSTLRPLWH